MCLSVFLQMYLSNILLFPIRSGLRHFVYLFVHFFSLSFQLEIDNGDELTGEFLYEEVHPKQHAHKQAFAKPKGPMGKRGGQRITRAPGDDDD